MFLDITPRWLGLMTRSQSSSIFREYFNVGFAVAKMFEMNKEQQNQVALYLFNKISLQKT